VTRIIDISASQGHIVPTTVIMRGANFFVGNLNTFPVKVGSSAIYKITPSGNILKFVPNLTTVLGVAVDDENRLYALETTSVSGPGPTPGTGRIVRLQPNSGVVEVIATGLTFPTAMTFGPDGALYVSTFGFGFPPGMGQVVRVEVP
jgi:sugar lactone lactonase YvrE